MRNLKKVGHKAPRKVSHLQLSKVEYQEPSSNEERNLKKVGHSSTRKVSHFVDEVYFVLSERRVKTSALTALSPPNT